MYVNCPMRDRRYDKSSTTGLLEKWNAELLEKNKALEERLTKAKIAAIESLPGNRTLQECESVIENGLSAHVEAWFALKEIHDRKLYGTKYESFKDYCLGRWGYRQEGYRYLQAAEVTQVLLHENLKAPPTSAHARALAPLLDEPAKMKEAWELSLELNDGHPTFLEVKDIVDGFLPKGEKTIDVAQPNSPELGPTDDGRESGESQANRLTPELGSERVGEPGGLTAAYPVVPPSPGGELSTPVVMGLASQPLSDIAAGGLSFPSDGLWDLGSIRQFRGKFNGMIREAAKHVSEPDVKVWMQSLYGYIKAALGYDV